MLSLKLRSISARENQYLKLSLGPLTTEAHMLLISIIYSFTVCSIFPNTELPGSSLRPGEKTPYKQRPVARQKIQGAAAPNAPFQTQKFQVRG